MAGYFRHRRALSSIVTSLILVAIVATAGSVVLFRGLGEVNTFSFNLRDYDNSNISALQEDLIFENVHFFPTNKTISITISNIGTVESTISSISVVKVDTQEMIFPPWNNNVNESIQIDSSKTISIEANLDSDTWNSTSYNASPYKISITTSKGNFFSTAANPYNT